MVVVVGSNGTMLLGSEGVVGSGMSSSNGEEVSCYTIQLGKEWGGIELFYRHAIV